MRQYYDGLSTAMPLLDADPFINPTEMKIRGLSRYRDGWKFGQGNAFSADMIESASQLNKFALNLGFLETDIFPGDDGVVALCLYHGENCIEIIFDLDGRFELTWECADKEKETLSKSSLNEMKQELQRMRNQLCTSESSISNSTISGRNGLTAFLLETVHQVVFRSYATNAPFVNRSVHAVMSGHTIQT